MEVILRQTEAYCILYLHSNDMNSLKCLVLKKKKLRLNMIKPTDGGGVCVIC